MSKITPIIRLIVPLLPSAGLMAGCLQAGGRSGFTREERRILREQDSVLYVTVVTDPSDSLILRTPCTDLSDRALRSEHFRLFAEKLKATVQAPWEDGVGIAGPQVGMGYLGLPEKTAEVFTENLFEKDPLYGRTYHTGDIVRWREDGDIEFHVVPPEDSAQFWRARATSKEDGD